MAKLTAEAIKKRKESLLISQIQIRERIDALRKQDPFTDPDRVNDNAASDTEASEESDHDRVSSLLEELTLQSKDIDNALIRLEAGTYGLCQNCGESIEESRLAIVPTATLCSKCEKLK